MGLFRSLLGLKPTPCRYQPVSGYYGDAPYGELVYQSTDGMRAVHMAVRVRCRHCGQDFAVARFHTSEAVLKLMDAERKARRRALSESPPPPAH